MIRVLVLVMLPGEENLEWNLEENLAWFSHLSRLAGIKDAVFSNKGDAAGA